MEEIASKFNSDDVASYIGDSNIRLISLILMIEKLDEPPTGIY